MIVVYGATGLTGTLVARALSRRGLPLVLSGRERSRLEALAGELGGDVEVRPAAVHDPDSLAAAMAGARLVVSCAGPFLHIGEPVVKAAIEAGVHYLDTAGEQAFIRDVHERYESSARRAGVVVVTSFAFEIALGDWAAALAAADLDDRDQAGRDSPFEEVYVAYAVDGFRPSRGTQLSVLSSVAAPGCVWLEDRWEPVAPAAEVRTVHFPSPFGVREALSFPSGEVITVPRHVTASKVQTYASLTGDSPAMRLLHRMTSAAGPVLPALLRSPLGALARARLAAAPDPDETERARARFAIVAEATRHFKRRRIAITGADVYGVTAEIVAFGASELLAGGERPGGVLAPAEVFNAEAALADLADLAGLEVTRS